MAEQARRQDAALSPLIDSWLKLSNCYRSVRALGNFEFQGLKHVERNISESRKADSSEKADSSALQKKCEFC